LHSVWCLYGCQNGSLLAVSSISVTARNHKEACQESREPAECHAWPGNPGSGEMNDLGCRPDAAASCVRPTAPVQWFNIIDVVPLVGCTCNLTLFFPAFPLSLNNIWFITLWVPINIFIWVSALLTRLSQVNNYKQLISVVEQTPSHRRLGLSQTRILFLCWNTWQLSFLYI
jgi:hypothetical protein